MNIGIVGLGLIGGSIAKAIKDNTNHKVYGTDIKEPIVYRAILLEVIDEKLSLEKLGECDLIIIALYPKAAISFIKDHSDLFKKGSMLVDCCGIKEDISEVAGPIAKEKGFYFVGGHPMAGIEFSGFEHSKKNLFRHASMVLTPSDGLEIGIMDKLKKLWVSIGFTHVQISTPKEHDRIIAFTSQLAHVVSSAYIKSPTAAEHMGFSAGSYKDLSRVAKLNPDMWTELFLMNKENLVDEIDSMIENLEEYKAVIKEGNEKDLRRLLQEGTDRKVSIDMPKIKE